MNEGRDKIDSLPPIDFLEAVRSRPAMYFGPLGPQAIEELIDQVVTDAVDEFLCQNATEINVKIDAENIMVVDDGVGLPFEITSPDTNESLATFHLTKMHGPRSRLFSISNQFSSRHFSWGLAHINAVSKYFDCRSWRHGKLWQQSFEHGNPTSPPIVLKEGNGRGTSINLIPNAQVFQANSPRLIAVRGQLFEKAHLLPGLKIGFQQETFHAPNGIADLLFILYPGSKVHSNPRADCPIFNVLIELDDVKINAVAVGETNQRCTWHSWVNGFPSVEHGTHRLGFSDALRSCDWEPVVALIHVELQEPRYTWTTRDQLAIPEVRHTISRALMSELQEYCESNHLGRFRSSQQS